MDGLREGMDFVGRELQKEYTECVRELNEHKIELQDCLSFTDSVKGFDLEFMVDENIDFLDIYAPFLGADYAGMKVDFARAVESVNEIYRLEFERLGLKMPPYMSRFEEEWPEKEQNRLGVVYDNYIRSGKGREKYWERLQLEFPGRSREQLEGADACVEFRRW